MSCKTPMAALSLLALTLSLAAQADETLTSVSYTHLTLPTSDLV